VQNINRNELSIPLTVLQDPLFSRNLPVPFQYGSVGFLTSRDVSQGFDLLGSNFGKNGQFQNWWDDRARGEFNKRSTCFVDQFNNFEFSGRRVNGQLTLLENVADLNGIKIAYNAFRNSFRNKSDVWKFNGRRFNGDQLFFLGFAQNFCSKTDNSALNQVFNSQFSPSPLRVRGVLSNFEEFSRAFGCRKGSVFNTVNKCAIF
jgi:predicted metalloendopeptidase